MVSICAVSMTAPLGRVRCGGPRPSRGWGPAPAGGPQPPSAGRPEWRPRPSGRYGGRSGGGARRPRTRAPASPADRPAAASCSAASWSSWLVVPDADDARGPELGIGRTQLPGDEIALPVALDVVNGEDD